MSHSCVVCNKTFDYPSILKLHCRSHTDEKHYRCEFCPRKFSYEAYLIVHKQIHFQNEESVGGLYNNTFLQKSFVEVKQLHTSQRKEMCLIEGFPNQNDSDSPNVSTIQDKRNTFGTFGEEISKGCHLNRGNYIENEEEHYVYEFCNNLSVHQSALDDRIQLYTTERKDETSVNEGFPTENVLDDQSISLKLDKFQKYVACNEVFSENCDLDHRFFSQKDGKPISENKICDVTFSKKSKISSSYSNCKKQIFCICDACGQSFLTKELLDKHYRIHATEKTSMCDICYKSFLHKRNLNQHYRTHTIEKPFICNICDRAFSKKFNLNRHYRIHSNEKPLVCNICDKAFSQKASLNRHQLVHSKEKPFICNICNKAFSQKSSLNRHNRIHSNEKPFICNM